MNKKGYKQIQCGVKKRDNGVKPKKRAIKRRENKK